MDEVLILAADLLFKGRMALDSLLRITEYSLLHFYGREYGLLHLKNESNIIVPFYLSQNCVYG